MKSQWHEAKHSFLMIQTQTQALCSSNPHPGELNAAGYSLGATFFVCRQGQLTHFLTTRKPSHNTLTAPGNVVHHGGHQSHTASCLHAVRLSSTALAGLFPPQNNQKIIPKAVKSSLKTAKMHQKWSK